MNGRYAWLDDEQVIFDLKYYTSRSDRQVAADVAHILIPGEDEKIPIFPVWRKSAQKLRLAGRIGRI